MEGLTQRISRAMLGQEQATITILSTLLAVQDELGYLPKEGIESVARFYRLHYQRRVGRCLVLSQLSLRATLPPPGGSLLGRFVSSGGRDAVDGSRDGRLRVGN